MNSPTGIKSSVWQALRVARRHLREARYRLLRRIGRLGSDWGEALPEELSFWENALKDGGRGWIRSEYQERMDPNLEFQDFLKALINSPPEAVVRVLDVGCGPLTRLGKKWNGRRLELYPVDPLAAEYVDLLDRLEIKPPMYPQIGHGEKLLDQFHENYFDLAYASNALDHSYDPLLAIRQMFAVIKPGCYVYLWHFARVGLHEGYGGLHQWNFEVHEGDMFLSDGRGRRCSLAAEFKRIGQLECETQSFCGQEVAVAKLKKLKPS